MAKKKIEESAEKAARRERAARLKEARLQAAVPKGRSLSQDDFAELLGELLKRTLHPTQYRRYETAGSDVPYAIVQAAARLSGLTEAYIAFGTEPRLTADLERLHRVAESPPVYPMRPVNPLAEGAGRASSKDAKGK